METTLSVCQWMNGQRCACIYVCVFNIIQPYSHKKERNPALWNHIDGTWGHDAKWNKSDRETQILFDSKKPNLQKQRVEWGIPRTGGGVNGEMLIKNYKLPLRRWISSGDLMHSIVIIINSTLLQEYFVFTVLCRYFVFYKVQLCGNPA